MYSVYQHWDQLDTCVVGKSYPPEFYSWIKKSSTRSKFEKLAEETEEDFQQLIKLLKSFDVSIVRPELPADFSQLKVNNRWVAPPVTPRDYFLMIHDKLWVPSIPNRSHAERIFSNQSTLSRTEFDAIDQQQHDTKLSCYQNILDHVREQGNQVVYTEMDVVSGCFVSRIGNNLYFATQNYNDDQTQLTSKVDLLFPTTKNKIVNAGGHGDATYCPVCPGLIISLRDVPTYADTFPGWEVVYLPPSNYSHMRQFESSMKHNRGRWFIPGFENDTTLMQIVDYYFESWVGQVSETVFDVNILIINPTNIVVSSHNDQVEKACARHNINVHVVPFRHKYFWDAGMHCITNDLNRIGKLHNYF